MYDVSGIDDPNDLLNTSMVVPLTKCTNGWTYNFTGYFHSASTEFDWVCDDAWKPAFTQSMFYAGAIIGTLIFGWISDHYGRYGSFISSNAVLMVTGIAKNKCSNDCSSIEHGLGKCWLPSIITHPIKLEKRD